jgi:hypothetical protein
VSTDIGPVVATSLGVAIAEAASVLDNDAPLGDSTGRYRAVADEARVKAGRLEDLYDRLPDSTARPAVAAALADLTDDVDTAVARYETVRRQLDREGSALVDDGLDPAGVAALLLMNNDEDNVEEFNAGYRRHRARGFSPAEAVEYALAGLLSRGEAERVRQEARRLDLPVAITAALISRRDDGAAVYLQLRDQLAQHVDAPGGTQTHVQHHHAHLGISGGRQTLLAAGGGLALDARLGEGVANGFAEEALVVDHEDTQLRLGHGGGLPWARRQRM